jgi:hypothetical protein
MRRRIAVLHHARSFFPMDLHRELSDEFEVIWVLCEEFDAGHRRLLDRLGSVVEIRDLDFDEAARAVARQKPDGIVSFVDDHIVIASEIAVRLGLAYHTPEVARVLADKRLQRAALADAGIPGPRFWSFSPAMTSDEFDDLARLAIFPAVLKRAHGAGSRDMHAVASAERLREILSVVDADHVWLLEEYVADAADHDPRFASYLSVESVVGGGRINHAAVTGRFPLAEPFRETGNFIPGIIPPAARGPVMEMVDATIAALQIETAVIHTEIKITPDGPRLIEVNGRLGGRPPFVLERVSDVNLFRVACELAVGEVPHLNGLAACSEIGFWRMLQPPMAAQRIVSIDGLDELAALDGVDFATLDRSPGELVDWRDGTDGHVVTVRGAVADYDELAAMIALIERTVEITYED